MPIKAMSEKQSTAPVSVGSHQAVCYGVVAVGTQPSEKFTPRPKVVILWELPHERGDFGEKKDVPRVISKRYTLSLSDRATLRADLQNWRGKPFTDEELSTFEIDRLIGANCLLSVQHEVKGPKTYANVTSVMPLTKGMAKANQETPRLYFNLVESIDRALVENTKDIYWPPELPEWLVNLCKASEEYVQFSGGKKPAAPVDHDVRITPVQDESVPF